MRKQIVLALVIGLVLCPLMICQNAGRVAGSGLGVNPRLYAGNGGPTTVQIHPSNDAYVSSEEPGDSAGAQPYLYVYTNGDEYRSFLKFNLSSIPDDAEVQSAALKVLIGLDHWPWFGSGASVEVRKVTNDAWSEGTITWNNQPPYGSLLDTVTQSFYEGGEVVEKWWEWSVTSQVRSELSGDKTASFCLKATENECWFCAEECPDASKRPYLEVTYTVPEPGKDPTTLAVSPASFTLESGQGRTLTATLTSDGTPLAGKTVTWSRTAGTLSTGSGVTDSSGQVSVTYIAPTVETQTLVTVTASFAGDDQYQSSSGNSSGTVTAPVVTDNDTDNDGLLDEWENTYFGNLDQGPGDDPDGDGYTNLQEYQENTNPNNAASHPGAPENQEGEGVPAGAEFPYLVLIAAVVIVIGAVGAFVWIKRRGVKGGWEPKEGW